MLSIFYIIINNKKKISEPTDHTENKLKDVGVQWFPNVLLSLQTLIKASYLSNFLENNWSSFRHCTFSLPQDFQLWCDLREFEQRMGSRYLTHQGDEERWIRYAQERQLSFPSHLCWDPYSEPDMWPQLRGVKVGQFAVCTAETLPLLLFFFFLPINPSHITPTCILKQIMFVS